MRLSLLQVFLLIILFFIFFWNNSKIYKQLKNLVLNFLEELKKQSSTRNKY